MSVTQGGYGFSFLALPVYTCGTEKCTNVDIAIADIPDTVLKFVLAKVNV